LVNLIMSRAGIPRGPRLAALLIALSLPAAGCATPSEPPEPPSGGQELNLSFAQFEASVEPILTQQGCDAVGDCHGGGIRGSLQLSPPDAKDVQFDFDQVALQVSASDPENSPILTEPLAIQAGGTPHSYEPFSSTADTSYQAILQWIQDGVQP
jgi:hypothetical protein